ncbi:MAG: 2-C-methyl-D-erythritol 4-phosphate cytidylyltransferase [Verrucomicrobiota bacterium]|jgi:2-C-methyl-D-erythritol 4-phosphate cytidylyltransferase
MLSAIIVAAGSGQRMGFDKLFALLGDKPVISHTLDVFERTDCIDEIILVGRAEQLTKLQELVANAGLKKVRYIISGGTHRQDSVRAGLDRLGPDTDYVAVHDAARPLVLPKQIERAFGFAREHGAAALAAPITDTIKRADPDCFVTGGVGREGLYAMQTPQIFCRKLLVQAYDAVVANNLSITDEVSAVEHVGAKVFLVANDEFNPKITYPRDLWLAQSALNRRSPSK